MSNLNALSASALIALYNCAVIDYAPEGFAEVKKFASKGKAVDAIEALCAAGNLAVEFNGDTAEIVDAMSDTPENDDEGDDVPAAAPFGDGKGKVRPWGFALGSPEWLKANPRGTADREAYRDARRKAARMSRKSARKAKEALRADAE